MPLDVDPVRVEHDGDQINPGGTQAPTRSCYPSSLTIGEVPARVIVVRRQSRFDLDHERACFVLGEEIYLCSTDYHIALKDLHAVT